MWFLIKKLFVLTSLTCRQYYTGQTIIIINIATISIKVATFAWRGRTIILGW